MADDDTPPPTDADLGIEPSIKLEPGERVLTVGGKSKAASAPSGDQSPSDADLGIGPSTPSSLLSNTHDDEGWVSGGLKGTGTAVIKGLANIPGQYKNYANLVDYLMARGHAAISGRPLEEVQQDLQQRQAAADQGLGGWVGKTNPANVLPSGEDIAAPILKKTGEYEPDTAWGKAGMAGVETATSMLGPGGGMRARGAPVVKTAIIPAAKAAPLNFAAGAGAQEATDLTGDPLYGMAVGLGTSVAGEGATKTVKTIAKPLTKSSREAEVGRQILAASDNPQEVERKLFPGPMRPDDTLSTETIPGSRPTLAQWVGSDQGLNTAEMAARNEATGPNDPFAAVDKAQNQARLDALNQGRPAGADTMKPSEAFQAHLEHIDQSTEQAVNQLTQNAQAAAPRGILTPEGAGGTLRTAIESAKAAAKELRNKLYRAIDPDGTLNAVATDVYKTAQNVANSVSEWGKIKNADLKRLLKKMQNAPDVMRFKHLQDLEEDVTASMSREYRKNGESPDWRRLTRLKGALRDSINNAVDNQAKYRPEQTLEGYLKQIWGEYPNAGSATITVGGTRNSAEVVPGGTAASGSGLDGTGTTATRRSGPTTNDQGVSSEPLQPNFDAAAVDRTNTAKAAATEYGKTYKSEPVAGVLKGPFKNQYNKPAGAIPGEAFVKGDKGYETTSAFLKAADNSPDAIAAIKDHARSDLAEYAVHKDGTLDPAKYDKWRNDHDGSLRAIEERSPGFTDEFSTATRATDQMLAAQAARKQQLGDFQKSQAAAFLGKQTPTEVENTIGQILQNKDLSSIDGLIKQANAHPGVLDGLKKGAIDWMVREFTDSSSPQQWIKSKKFRDFVNDRYDTLAKLYGTHHANMLRAIAADLASAEQPSKATAPKRGPGTAKDVAPLLKKMASSAKEHTSLLGAAAMTGMGAYMEHGLEGLAIGAASGSLIYLMGSLRAAGVKTMGDMFRDALSNPERARAYISKVQPKDTALSAVTRSLRRELLLSKPIGAAQPVGRASGGRVRGYPAKKASSIEKQMNRICKTYGGELNPLLHSDDTAIARALRLANRGKYADGGSVAPEEGTVEGPTLNPFGVDPDRVRQITGIKPQAPLPGPAGIFGADVAKNAIEGAANAATLPGDAYLGKVDLGSDEGLGRVINMAGTLAQTGLPMAKPGTAGIFGGKLTRDPAGFAKLGEGKDMLTAGANPADVYLQTGAWKGPEGMMRYEIPDYNAALKTGAEAAIRTGKNFAGPLKDFIDHPEFFKAYPDLADTTVLFDPSKTSHHGYFASGSNLIKLYGHEPSQVQSVLLHEMQHAVQHKEGFTPGWSQEGAQVEAGHLLDKAHEAGMPVQKRNEFWVKFNPYDAYRRAAGEVEARAVQARAGLTPEQASVFNPNFDMMAQSPKSKWIVRPPNRH